MMALLFACVLLTMLSVFLNIKSLGTQQKEVQHNPLLHKSQDTHIEAGKDASTTPRSENNQLQQHQQEEKQQHRDSSESKQQHRDSSESAADESRSQADDNSESARNKGGSRIQKENPPPPPPPPPSTPDAKAKAAEERKRKLLEKWHAEELQREAEVVDHFDQLDGKNCRPSGELMHYKGPSSAEARRLCLQRDDCECVACDMDTVSEGVKGE